MKGKQLSLQEVLNLEDGSKVWVEDTDKYYGNVLCSYKKDCKHLKDIYDYEFESYYALEDYKDYGDRLTFYEWVEEEKESTLIMYGEIIESMANEIAMHRYPNKYEYDDKLIEKIIKEFEEDK